VSADLAGGPATEEPRHRDSRRLERVVEEARKRLRAGRRHEAAGLFDWCLRAFPRHETDDPLFAERRAYAFDLFTGERETSLLPEVLQRVIVWVTREELEAGERELATGRPFAAAKCFAAADVIDPRGTRAALLHAVALQRAARKAAARASETDSSELHNAERYLRNAIALAGRAATDPVFQARSAELAAAVETQLAELKERQALAGRQAAVRQCLEDYNAFVNHYNDNPLRTALDYANFRSSLATLGGRVNRLRRRCPPESEEGWLLTKLADGIAGMQRELPF
jgi:hypothetical protein